ncbi:sigma-54-dependent Fis family transcriptional regulator [bacterium]|nr:sigma-54-dependent Fis family transcriptional regulator [bacterium]
MEKNRILIIDDELSILETFSIYFESMGIDVETSSTFENAIKKISTLYFDAILTDLKLGNKTGLDILNFIKESGILTPVILITAFASKENAIEATKLGIYDYLTKPINFDELHVIVSRAIEKSFLQKEINKLKEDISPSFIIGESKAVKNLLDIIKRVSTSDVNVLITGESGTGKELVAKAIHQFGKRNRYPFIPLNCGAIPENLIESELFGYTKGAFTGASMNKDGIFAAAKGGTVFLDEIGELPIYMQPKLLRVIQEQKVRRIGEQFEIDIDTRIVAATNRDLKKEVDEKKFREDLYYRLNVINIHVPPLRERKSDIPLLINYFISKFNKKLGRDIKGTTNDVMKNLINYDFPGNIRELENIIERMMTLESGNILTMNYFPFSKKNETQDSIILPNGLQLDEFDPKNGVNLDDILSKVEHFYLKKALEYSNGIKKDAATLLNISFRSIRYRLEKHEISIDD